MVLLQCFQTSPDPAKRANGAAGVRPCRRVDLSTLLGVSAYAPRMAAFISLGLAKHFTEGKLGEGILPPSFSPHGCCYSSSRLLACSSLHLHCFLVSFIISPRLTLHHVIFIARLLPLPVRHITAARTHFPIF